MVFRVEPAWFMMGLALSTQNTLIKAKDMGIITLSSKPPRNDKKIDGKHKFSDIVCLASNVGMTIVQGACLKVSLIDYDTSQR